MNRRQKTRAWFKRHSQDPFVKKAKQAGYRSRAAYKLLELLPYLPKHAAPSLLELGAAPGGWTQVLCAHYPHAKIVGIDLLPMDPIPGALLVTGDMRSEVTWSSIPDDLRPFHGILSDMMPNTSGVDCVDQYALIELLEHILTLAQRELRPGGWLLVKYFEGYGIAAWRQSLRPLFKDIVVKKPSASRPHSREQYLLATGYQKR